MKYFIICGLINDLVNILKESFENETVNCVITEDSLEIYLDNGYYCNFNIYEITDLK